MCCVSTEIFFLRPNGPPCASLGAQHPALETTGPEGLPGRVFSSLLPLLLPSPSANNPLSFFHFHPSSLVHRQAPSRTLLGWVLWGLPAGEMLPPIFIPSAGCAAGQIRSEFRWPR